MRTQQCYSVGIYCRLSRDDNNGSSESMSIATQRDLLTAYAKERRWNVYDAYIDDGISGTTFERPSFQRMIADIENGKINCVITKDLSRLGRNYVQVGQYTDFFFPRMGVRYIAVNDDFDSLKSDNDIAPFRNVLNEMYAKDTSKKVRSARMTKAKQGKFMGSKAPYGYVKSTADKHLLVPDPEAAEVIRRIFSEFAQGDSGRNIAVKLTADGIDSPRTYHYKKIGRENPNPEESQTWGSNTVMQLLKNQVYIGHMVQGKREVVSFKTKERQFRNCEDWIIVENTHEPLIDLEIWQKVQDRIEESKKTISRNPTRVNRNNVVSTFSGIIRCAECGSSMAFNSKPQRNGISEQYRCTRYAIYGKAQCTTHAITLETLESVVLADIKYYASIAAKDEAGLANRFMGMAEQQIERTHDVQKLKIRDSKKRISEIDRAVKNLFEEKVAGNVPESIFRSLLFDYEAEQNALRQTITENEEQMAKTAAVETDVMTWIRLVKACFGLEKLDRATALELIDCIEVSEQIAEDGTKQQSISIKYKFIGNVDEIPEISHIGA